MVDALCRETRRDGELSQHAVASERREIDEQRAPRERRAGAIGRIALSGRADGKHLPPALAGRGELPGEPVRLGAEVAVAMWAGQRREMEKHATAPFFQIEHPVLSRVEG